MEANEKPYQQSALNCPECGADLRMSNQLPLFASDGKLSTQCPNCRFIFHVEMDKRCALKIATDLLGQIRVDLEGANQPAIK